MSPGDRLGHHRGLSGAAADPDHLVHANRSIHAGNTSVVPDLLRRGIVGTYLTPGVPSREGTGMEEKNGLARGCIVLCFALVLLPVSVAPSSFLMAIALIN